MEETINWITDNKNWLFSGIGVLILTLILRTFINKENISQNITQNVTLNNLNDKAEKEKRDEDSLEHLKRKVKILFIDDDNKFKVVKILKNAGWLNTRLVKDIKSYDDQCVLESDIIFVDVQGVGKNVESKDEGLGLSMHLKKKYPQKKIIIYSAETKGDRFHEALRVADDFLAKNADSFEFQTMVEKFSKVLYAKK